MTATLPPARPPRGLLSRLLPRRRRDAAAAAAASLRVGQTDQLGGPIRGELLGAEGLAERAREVARSQRLLPTPATAREARRRAGRGGGPLFRRLAETQEILESAREMLTEAADRGADVSPAGDWLLDNYYVVEEHIRETRESMPVGYYAELPKLATGALPGYPRVYEVATELIAHTEGRLTLDNIETFVGEFQRVTPLTIGELWAIPAMLRLGLIESVRRHTLRTTQWLQDVEQADAWAARLRRITESALGGPAAVGGGDGGAAAGTATAAVAPQHAAPPAVDPSHALATALADFVRSHPPLTPAFVTRFLQLIRATQSSFTPLVWLEQWIAEDSGLTSEDAAARNNQRLALTQVMMANSITSLRAIARLDWKSFVESQSVLDRALRADPTGDYTSMTFAARDHYRHVVERIAKRTQRPEREVADAAVGLARSWLRNSAAAPATAAATAAAAPPGVEGDEAGRAPSVERRMAPRSEIVGEPRDMRRAHVGYYLIDDGRYHLERALGYRPTFGERVHRFVMRHPTGIYFGAMALLTWLALETIVALARPSTEGGELLVIVFALLPALEVGVGTLNQLVTLLMPPRTLPKLEFREHGIPDAHRTAVVVPTLFGSVAAVEEALEHLEVQFLANRDPSLHFAILSDFTDAPTETREGDAAILHAAVDGVRALNAKYDGGDERLFYLFHRPRLWNPSQGVWMGWERKRGKLAQFNQLLRGGAQGAFTTVVGDVAALRAVRYVITLDSDTVLPPDAARTLVGTMAHPLNRPVYDARVGRVIRGYGILQPRVGVSLPSAHRSLFASIHSGHPGVDPYTTAVSDVYQDLFAEGSFTGKGIYDVDAFERATHGRFPENTLLSHDLIEGNYARAGLVTDVEVYDDYPARYLTHTRRKHRWIRGDWQLLRWLRARVPGPHGRMRNRLSAISRWKIVDNLRRSLIEVAQLALLVAGWTILPGSPLLWTAIGVGVIAFPWVFSLVVAALRPPSDKSWFAYYAAVGRDALTSLQQLALAVTFLPHQAAVSVDAIVRTLHRLMTRRNLLEWQTASQVERSVTGARREVWRRMWPAVAIALVVGAAVLAAAAVAAKDVEHLNFAYDGRLLSVVVDHVPAWQYALAALPVVLLWAASPSIAHRLSAPAVRRELRLSVQERAAALRYALLHWRFFERFVTAESNWLAPDNFQEDPSPVVAPRTSPTNVGLQLMAVVSAHDLGVLTSGEVVERLERTLRTMERLRRFRGHLYNWYDTTTLRVLEPAYVSTVDSGNLAGHLLALRQACLELPDAPVFGTRAWRVLDIALDVTRERLGELASSGEVASPAAWRALEEAAERVRAARTATGRGKSAATAAGVHDALVEVEGSLRTVEGRLAAAGLVAGAEQSSERGALALEWLTWTAALATRWRAVVTEVIGVVDDGEGGAGTVPLVVPVGAASSSASSSSSPAAAGTEPAAALHWPTLRELAQERVRASEEIARLEVIAERARDFAMEMDFRFLFDDTRKLFAIGYNAQSGELDASYYDLLASESRLASFLAIAKSDVPVEHWFRLGRTLTAADAGTALVSWSGSMFEYLMPLLVMQSFPFTLLDQTYRGAVKRQMAYGSSRGVPWGISESAYNVRDRNMTYQYRGFGVPDLALKRGLGKELVVAPYATMLAVMVDPHAALANARTLERDYGSLGPYGFRESLDWTRPAGGTGGDGTAQGIAAPGSPAIVGSYFAHHVGMGLVALTNVLERNAWQRRFHADPMVRSAELILYERIPSRLTLQEAHGAESTETMPAVESEQPAVREYETADTPQPRVALLGNLPYTIMVTNGGGGYSRYQPEQGAVLAVTRWRADGTRDATGQWCFVRDLTGRRAWSAAHQPMCVQGNWYRATLANDRVVFHRRDGDVETVYEIAVVPDDRAEVRRVTVVNHSDVEREIELTSYGEIVLAQPDTDRAHPAFANLFVETEWLGQHAAVLATRRPRSAHEARYWCLHVAAVVGDLVGEVTCETDRARFLGRGRTVRDPEAVARGGDLSGTTGAVLDPIFALRARVRVAPGQSARVAFTTLVADERDRALELADRYKDPYSAQRALDLAWTQTQVELRDLAITPADAALYQQLAGHLFFSHPGLRAPQRELQRNQGSQQLLWSLGLSGDWPILLATIDSSQGLPTLRQLLAAHHYWRLKGMTVDLVVLNTRPASYLQELNEELVATVLASPEAGLVDRPGGVFIRRQDVMSSDDLLMLRATARVHLPCEGVPLGPLLERREPPVAPSAVAGGGAVEGEESGARGDGGGGGGAGSPTSALRVWGRGWSPFAGRPGAASSGGPPRVEVGRPWFGDQDHSSAGRTGSGAGSGGSGSAGGGGGAQSGAARHPSPPPAAAAAAGGSAGGGAAAAGAAATTAATAAAGGPPPTGKLQSSGGDAGTASPPTSAIGSGGVAAAGASAPAPTPLLFDNGVGGLRADTLDYEIRLGRDTLPPAPWSNVVATPDGGFCVTESGGGFAWVGNSYFFRLTPWHNDPVTDAPTEVLYLRDDETGAVWSATPAPVRHATPYRVTHGAGFSRFEHEHDAIATVATMAMGAPTSAPPVAPAMPAESTKVTTLAVTNRGGRRRRVSVTSYVEWALGVMREHTQHQVRTRFDRTTGAVLAQNFYDPQYAGYVAFSWMGGAADEAASTSYTADRREFVGRNGSLATPAALMRPTSADRPSLGGTTGAGIDPCAALQASLVLEPGETRELVVLLGAAVGEDAAREAIRRHGAGAAADAAAGAAESAWASRLATVRVRTPSPAFDAVVNRWALYQALACRMWARSALYQSSGAYGFRDQLQDVMAFVYAEPALAREHILRSAARQFLEGDVQHWWHPQTGRGVRTKFSDDLAWLPFVVDHYVNVTGDASVLDEYVPFLEMRELGPDEHEVYDLPRVTDEHGSVYEHCRRALRRACTVGQHGLPLIGIGDWNDGMNRVGVDGRGVSVWLAWFLTATLRNFATIAERRGESGDAAEWRAKADAYVKAVNDEAWDGAWYRRAYFDDGAPLGSSSSDECRIDSIAQSWSVISGGGAPDRVTQAMASLNEHLVREDARLIMLLTPAFDTTPHDPGYIKGYLPGVRENGAQYTHAALWAVLATALRGDGDRAFHLFDLLNPFTHGATPEQVATYKVEPYVVAADVYTAAGQLGRGGWTWYTGSASWMYRVALESIVGFTKRGDRLTLNPCVPRDWSEFAVDYRFGGTTYAITVRNPGRVSRGVASVVMDGAAVDGGAIPLVDDGRRREVVVTMGDAAS